MSHRPDYAPRYYGYLNIGLRYLIFHITLVDAMNLGSRFPIFVDQKVSSSLNIVINHIPICSPYGQW